jgi:hypothetical protein
MTVSRRTFLHASGLAALGVAAACSKTKKLPPTTGSLTDIRAGRSQRLQLFPSGTETLSDRPERILIGIRDPNAGVFLLGASVRLWIARDQTSPALGPFPMRQVHGGIDDRGLYEAVTTIPDDGIWLTLVEAIPSGATDPFVGLDNRLQVGRNSTMPAPGERAVSVATPTTTNHRGVNPICTRQPACSMHGVSLDDALRSGEPTVLTIGTPAYCQSQLCGPVVDVVQSFRARNPSVNFVHVEVLRDDEPETVQVYQGAPRPKGYKGSPLSPGAIAWELAEEPVTYYIDAHLRIVERHISALDETDVGDAIAKIV